MASRAGRGRLRAVLPFAAFVVGVLLLLVGADRLARAGAEALVASDVQGATGTETVPEVHVRGLLFLPQVLSGRYQEVDVTTTGVTSGPLRIDRVQSRLVDVRVPFHDVLLRDLRVIGVGRSEETVTLRWDDLNAYLAATGRPLTLTPGPDGRVSATGAVNVLGRHIDVRAVVKVDQNGSDLTVKPQSVDTEGLGLGDATTALLGQRLTLTIPMGTLPFGHQLTDVQTSATGITFAATGERLVVRP